MLLLLSSLFFINPSFTGQVVYTSDDYQTQSLNQILNQSTVIPLNISDLLALQISGQTTGDGSILIELRNENESYIVYSYESQSGNGNLLTGMVTGERTGIAVQPERTGEKPIGIDTTLTNLTEENISVIIENETDVGKFIEINLTENITINETEINTTLNIIENLTENISENISINITENITEFTNETETIQNNQTTDENIIITPEEDITPYPEFNAPTMHVLDRVCQQTCSLSQMQNAELVITISGNITLELNGIHYVKYFLLEQTKPFDNISLYSGETLELNLDDYFSGQNVDYDFSYADHSALSINKNIMTISAQTAGVDEIFIYATYGEQLVRSNTFNVEVLTLTQENITTNLTENVSLNITEELNLTHIVENQTTNVSLELNETNLSTVVIPEFVQPILNELQSKPKIRVLVKQQQTNLVRFEQEGRQGSLAIDTSLQATDYGRTLAQAKPMTKVDPAQSTQKVYINLSQEAKSHAKKDYLEVKQVVDDYVSLDLTEDELLALVQDGLVDIIIDEPFEALREESANLTKATDVQGLGYGGTGVNICVVDTGVNTSALNISLTNSYNVLNTSATVEDDNGHGTLVMSILSTFAPDANFIMIKALNQSGVGYGSDIVTALDLCYAYNADIVSLSLGGGLFDGYCDQELVASKVNDLVSNGTIVFSASGNNGNSNAIVSPACASSAIPVAASTKQDYIFSISNYNNATLILAPGSSVNAITNTGQTVSADGTSFATPMVSGAAALILENRTLNWTDMESLLIHTGDVISYPARDFSRLNVLNALNNNITNNLSRGSLSYNTSNETLIFQGQATCAQLCAASSCSSGYCVAPTIGVHCDTKSCISVGSYCDEPTGSATDCTGGTPNCVCFPTGGCFTGNDCTGDCIEAVCRTGCSATYDGNGCSDNSYYWTGVNSGQCARDNSNSWYCDKDEQALDTTPDYYTDCYEVEGRAPGAVYECDHDVTPDFTTTGICAYSSGTQSTSTVNCYSGEVCFDSQKYRDSCANCGSTDIFDCDRDVSDGTFSVEGVCVYGGNCDIYGMACFDDTDYQEDCGLCSSDLSDMDLCDYDVTDGYDPVGICTTSGECRTTVYDPGGSLESGCSNGGAYPCIAVTGTEGDIFDDYKNGVCVVGSFCVGTDVVYTSGDYYSSCYNRGGKECDADTSDGGYAQSGVCFSDGGLVHGTNYDCETSGYLFFDGTYYDDDTGVVSSDYDYDSDNDGEACDSSITSGGDYVADGMVTTSGCTATGSTVRKDVSNGNYFTPSCDSSADPCDNSVASSLTAPFGIYGVCASSACDADEVCDNEGTYVSDCSSCSVSWSDMDKCDSDVGTSFSADGVCTTGGTCSTGIYSFNVSGDLQLYDGCPTSSYFLYCDTDADGTEDGSFTYEGGCVNGGSCDVDDICYTGSAYYGSMSSCSEGDVCDHDVSDGWRVADGDVFTNDGTNLCCNAGESYEDSTGLTNCCYNGALKSEGAVFGTGNSLICSNGLFYDCGNNGGTTSPDADTTVTSGDCTAREGLYCIGTTWGALIPDDCSGCDQGTDCDSGLCVGGTCRTSCTVTYDKTYCSSDSAVYNGGSAGVCTGGDGTCDYGLVADSTVAGTGNLYSDCSDVGATKRCDTDASTFSFNGACSNSNTCVTSGVLTSSGATTCGSDAEACDSDVGSQYTADGMCASSTCDTDAVFYDDETSYYYSTAQTAQYDYDLDTTGDSCDGDGGTSYSRTGMVVSDGTNCDAVGGTVAIDASNGNYYVADCDTTGDYCDSATSNSDNPFLRDGSCVTTTCATQEVASGEYGSYWGQAVDWTGGDEGSDCTGNAGEVCDDSPEDGTVGGSGSDAGVCVDGTCDSSIISVNCGATCDTGDFTDANMATNCANPGWSCDHSITAFTGYNPDGICVTGFPSACDTSGGHTAYNSGTYYGDCATGYECDGSLGGGNYVRDGYCASTSCCTSVIVSGETSGADWSGGDESCTCTGHDGELCDSTPASGPSVEGICVGGSCVSGTVVDTDQDGVFDTSGCTASYNGDLCDVNYNGVADGVCVGTSCDSSAPAALNCGTDGCSSADEAASAWTSCSSSSDGESCQSSFASFTGYFFTQSGLCSSTGCETSGYVFYDGTIYDDANVATADYDADTDSNGRSCDASVTSGGDYNADGMVTLSGCTTTGSTVRKDVSNGNYFTPSCDSSGDSCDISISSSLTAPFTADGVCASSSCDQADVVLDTSSYYGNCDGHGGKQCDSVTSDGSFTQDGICFDNGGVTDGTHFDCETSGYVFYDGTYYDDVNVVAADYDYDSNNDGVSCDSSLTGGDYSAMGMLTTSGCTASGVVRIDASNGNYFTSGCDLSMDLCDTATANHLTITYGSDGRCASSTCATSGLISYTGGNYYTTCSNGDGRACDSSRSGTASYSQDGICVSGSSCDIDDVCYYSSTYYGSMSSCTEGSACDSDVAPTYNADGVVFTDDTGNLCCNGGEDYEQAAASGSCCYNGAILASGASSGSVQCYNGELYDCGSQVTTSPDADTNNVACDIVGGLHCDTSTNTWNSLIPIGCTGCSAGDDCTGSGLCIEGTCDNTCSGYTTSENRCSDNTYAYDSTNGGVCVYNSTAVAYYCENGEVADDDATVGRSFVQDCALADYGDACDDDVGGVAGYEDVGVCGNTLNQICLTNYAADPNNDASSPTIGTTTSSASAVCTTGSNGYYCDDVSDAIWSPGNQRCDESDTSCRTCTFSTGVDTEGLCESGCGADASADEISPNSCDGTSGYVNSTCTYFSDGDSNTETCSCLTDQTTGGNDQGKEWNIGGEVASTTCCGDDASEYDFNSLYDASLDSTPATTDACCDTSTDCVYSNTCYATAYVSSDIDSDGDNDYCNAGTWYDCNANSECGVGYYCSSNDCLSSTLDVTYVSPTPADAVRQIANSVTINVTVDSVGTNVDTCLLEWQGSNESMTKVGSGTSVTCYKTKTTVDGTAYTFKVYANNTAGTQGNESQRGFTENTKPPAPTHATPSDTARLYGNSQTITWTAGSVDSEADTITYYWYLDTNDPPNNPYDFSGSTTSLNSGAQSTVDGTTYYWNIIASDGYENQTITSTWEFTENAKPSISSVSISPGSPTTDTDLNCSVGGWSDSEGDSAQYYYVWYKDGVEQTTIGPTSTTYNVMDSSFLANDETWNCSVTPYDGYENGTALQDSVSITQGCLVDTTVILSQDLDCSGSTLNITASGDLTAGIYNVKADEMAVYGNFSSTSGSLNITTGTGLTVFSSGSVSSGTGSDYLSDLTLTSGSSYTATSDTTYLSGDLNISSGTFTNNNGVINLTGTGSLINSYPGQNFYTLAIGASGKTTTINSATTVVTNQLIIGSGTVVSNKAWQFSGSNSEPLVINPSATLTLSGSNKLDIYSSVDVSLPGKSDYYALQWDPTQDKTLTLTGDTTFSSYVMLEGQSSRKGTINTGNYDLTVGGTLTIGNTLASQRSGVLISGSGTITANSIVIKESTSLSTWNATGTTINITGDLSIENTADMNLLSTSDLTVDGSTSVSGSFSGGSSTVSHGSLSIASTGTYSATSGTTYITSQDGSSYSIDDDGTLINNNGKITIQTAAISNLDIVGTSGTVYDLEIDSQNNANEISLVGASTISNDLIVTSGTFAGGAYTHTISGDLLKTGGRIKTTSSNDVLDIAGNLNSTGGDLVDASSSKFYVARNVDITGSTFNLDSGWLYMDGSVDATINSPTSQVGGYFLPSKATGYKVTANSDLAMTHIIHKNGVLDVNGYTINASGVYYGYSGATLTMSSGYLQVRSSSGGSYSPFYAQSGWSEQITGGTIDLTGSRSATWGLAHFASGSDFTPTGGLFKLSGSSNSDIQILESSTNFYDLEIDRSGATINFTGTLDVNHELNITAGTLDSNGNNLEIGTANVEGIMQLDAGSTLTFTTTGGFANSSGTLNAPGTAGSGITVTGSSGWDFAQNMDVSATYTTFDAYYSLEEYTDNARSFIATNCVFQNVTSNRVAFFSTYPLTLTNSVFHTTSTNTNGLYMDVDSGTYMKHINMTVDGPNAKIYPSNEIHEFINSTFTSAVTTSSGSVVSKNHNNTANDYRIWGSDSAGLTKSAITTYDFSATDNITLERGALHINEAWDYGSINVTSGTLLNYTFTGTDNQTNYYKENGGTVYVTGVTLTSIDTLYNGNYVTSDTLDSAHDASYYVDYEANGGDWVVGTNNECYPNSDVNLTSDLDCSSFGLKSGLVFDTNGHTLNVTGDAEVNGKLYGRTADQSFGSLLINSGATYDATSATTYITSNDGGGSGTGFNNLGTFNHNSGTVHILNSISSGYTLLSGSMIGSNAFYNVISEAVDRVLWTADITVDNDVTVNDGQFSVTSGATSEPIIVTGKVTVNSGGAFGRTDYIPTGTFTLGEIDVKTGGIFSTTTGTTYMKGNFNRSGTFNAQGGTVLFDDLGGDSWIDGNPTFSTLIFNESTYKVTSDNLGASRLELQQGEFEVAGSIGSASMDFIQTGGLLSTIDTSIRKFTVSDLNLSGGTINGAVQLNIYADLNVSGGTMSGCSYMIMAGAADQSVYTTIPLDKCNFYISIGSKNVTLNSDLDIGSRLFLMYNGGSGTVQELNLSSHTLDVGSFELGYFNAGTYKLHTPPGSVINVSGTVKIGSRTDIVQTTVLGTADTDWSFDVGGAVVIGSLSLGSHTVNLPSTSGYADFASTLNIDHTGTMNSPGNLAVAGSVTVNGTYDATGSGTQDFGSSLTIQDSGTYDATSGTTEINGAFTRNNGGTFNHNSGTVELTASSTLSTPSDSAGFNGAGKSLYNLIVDASTIMAKSVTVNIVNKLTLNGEMSGSGVLYLTGGAGASDGDSSNWFEIGGSGGFTAGNTIDIHPEKSVGTYYLPNLPSSENAYILSLTHGNDRTFMVPSSGELYLGSNLNIGVSTGISAITLDANDGDITVGGTTTLGSATSDGTLLCGSGTISLSALTITDAGVVNAETSTFTSTGTTTLDGNFTGGSAIVSHGILTINSGSIYTATSQTTSITNQFTDGAGVMYHNNGLFSFANGAQLRYDGSPYYDVDMIGASTANYMYNSPVIEHKLELAGQGSWLANAFSLTMGTTSSSGIINNTATRFRPTADASTTAHASIQAASASYPVNVIGTEWDWTQDYDQDSYWELANIDFNFDINSAGNNNRQVVLNVTDDVNFQDLTITSGDNLSIQNAADLTIDSLTVVGNLDLGSGSITKNNNGYWTADFDSATSYSWSGTTISYGNNTGSSIIDARTATDGGNNVPVGLWWFYDLTLEHENTFVNSTTEHHFNVTAGVSHQSGYAVIENTTITYNQGTCTNIANSTNGIYFNATYECVGTPYVSNTVSIEFCDIYGACVSTTSSANAYPNQAPTMGSQLTPTNNNITVHDLTPEFTWTAGSDVEGDSFNYTINITTDATCAPLAFVFEQSVDALTYTPTEEYCPDALEYYYWKVKACDEYGACSSWHTTWQFILEPYVDIEIVGSSTMAFGSMTVSTSNDTTNGDPAPFWFRNNGNVLANLINITSNNPLWSAAYAGFGTNYMRVKARATAETGSYDDIRTRTSWENYDSATNDIISGLNYSDSNDESYIDVEVTTPATEIPGSKSEQFTFTWEQDTA